MPNNKMERFTQRARRVLTLAQEEAERLLHKGIDSEHMLMGLMREEGGVAGKVLRDLGVEQQRVEALMIASSPSDPLPQGQMAALTAGCKRILELAVDEARRMGHHYIGTEHLLLGLVRQTDTKAVDILKQMDVTPEQVRRQTRRVLQESPIKTNEPVAMPSASTIADNPFTLMQVVIFKVLKMVEQETLTLDQASELLSTLVPHLKLTGIEQRNLANQLSQMQKVKNYRVRFNFKDMTNDQALGELNFLLPQLMNVIDLFIGRVLDPPPKPTPLTAVMGNFRLEVEIDMGETNDAQQ